MHRLPGLLLLMVLACARADSALDERVLRLTENLRCLVCQNQTVAESRSPLANDLRRQVREQLAAGRDESQVIDFMVVRYGDFVLYRPPLKSSTWLLWLGPFVLLLLSCGGLMLALRQRGRRVDGKEAPFRPEELAEAEALLYAKGKEAK
jgi:cytochrome c-type biogenesis protein CcmH